MGKRLKINRKIMEREKWALPRYKNLCCIMDTLHYHKRCGAMFGASSAMKFRAIEAEKKLPLVYKKLRQLGIICKKIGLEVLY